ncbi:MAG: MarR family transcriptional regulator [Gammaproteobacteria bacterium]|nr:MAG: MarR family transcriptional regulator [Gammaproteobacteria bacterium]
MDNRLFYLLNQAQHAAFRFADTACKSATGLSVTQAAALMHIARHEGAPQKSLADAMGLNAPAVTGLVSRLRNGGWIHAQACEHDKRATRLFLTEAGRELLPRIHDLVSELNHELSGDFSEAELATVTRFFHHVIQRFKG